MIPIRKWAQNKYAVCPVKGVPKARTWIQALKLQSLFSTSASSCLNLNLSIRSKSTSIKQTVTGLTWTVWKYTFGTTQKNYTVSGWLMELEIRWGVEILGIFILGRTGLQRHDNSSKFLKDWAMVPFTLLVPPPSWAHSRTALPTPISSLRWDWGHMTSSDQQTVSRSDVYHLLPMQDLARLSLLPQLRRWFLCQPGSLSDLDDKTHHFRTHNRHVDNPEVKI